jgi:hypothetical protein
LKARGDKAMFDEELEYFISNQDDLVKKYRGKFLVIKGKSILGVYPSALEAYLSAQRSNDLGSVMIQSCEAGPDAYTVTIATSNMVSLDL